MRVRRLAAPLLALALVAGCGGSSRPAEPSAAAPAPAATPAAPVECQEEEFESQGLDHATELPPGFEYNSFPPTSGPHHPQAAPWNLYTRPVPQLHLVHNLEHGGIVVQFGRAVSDDVLRQIVEWYLDSPDGLVVAPLPELGDTVALTAWQHLLACTGFDASAFTAFRDEYRFHGPEEVPPELMRPQGT
jgi:hypothetical protein